MRIEDFMDDMARRPSPPSRLTADEVYDAGMRRHRRSRRLHGMLIAGTMAALAGVVTLATHTFQVGPFAPSSSDASVNISTSPALPTAKPALPVPLLPTALPTKWPSPQPDDWSCEKVKARVLDALQDAGFTGKAGMSCKANDVVVKVSLTSSGNVTVRIVVEVSTSDLKATSKASICAAARTSKCDETTLGPLAMRTDGSVVLGTRTTVIWVYAEVDSPQWSGHIKFVITAEQMRALCLKLGGRL